MIKLNDKQRIFLKKPFAKPIKKPSKNFLKNMNCKFILVGDESTKFFVENEIEFSVCVVDYKTERKPLIQKTKEMINSAMKGREILKINNPPGIVSDDAINMVKEWVDHQRKLFVIVNGEDDLVALLFFLLAPENYCIIYGIRNKGMVIKQATKQFKKEIMEGLKISEF